MPPRWPSQTLGTPGQVEKVDCQVSKPLTWTPFDPFCPPCPKLHHDTETSVIYIPPVTGETEATVTWWGRREEEKEWVEMQKEKGNRIFKTSSSSKNHRISALVSVPGHGCSVYISTILLEPVEAADIWVSVSCTSDCRQKGAQSFLLYLPEGTSPR